MSAVAFIGLGVMGYPMAGRIVKKGGHSVTVYNRSPGQAERWVNEFGGQRAATPQEAATGADFIFTCVGNDGDLKSVTVGVDGAFHGLKPGAVFIDNTTASAGLARELHGAAREKRASFLDAPVSGGQSGAQNGTLTVMVGGDADALATAKPVIDCYARAVNHLGPSGAGQLTKMVNQICIAGLLQGLSEGIHFAQSAGLDVTAVIETISKGAAQSWQMENRSATMAEGRFDFGFAVAWMRKDLGICLDEARRNGAQLPVTALVDQFYADLQAEGGDRLDTSSLISRLKKRDTGSFN